MNNLYPENMKKQLDMAVFKNPPAVYRGTPFWSWNNKLDKQQLFRQIEILKEMGLGGGHMHARTGMGTEYMSEEFLDIVKGCVEKFKSEGMLGWLYDEDRWPSGFAGGLVTENEEYRSRYLLFTPTPYSGKGMEVFNGSRAGGNRNEKGELLCQYAIRLDVNGCLGSYRQLEAGSAVDSLAENEDMWYLYCEVSDPSSWFNNQSYADTMNPAAVRKFIEVTHERYFKAVGEEFGKAVPAIFTDEPQFSHKKLLNDPFAKNDVYLPYTGLFPQEYAKEYSADFFATFPEIVWERADNKPSVHRYRYHDFISELFARSFADQLGDWCEDHEICLTGHMMSERTLESQTNAIGDAMRSYRKFQLPGIDILCDHDEFSTAKQAQSAARQYGCPGVLSELYGVTGWDFDFAGHKRQGDWQAAMGITVRVQHLSWVSMAGEAKRDYPASISYQSPWWKEYPIVEDHFSRVNAVLSRGKPVCRVAMIHPIESFWICYGPASQTSGVKQDRDTNFTNSIEWLLKGLVDFDFLAESLLPGQEVAAAGKKLKVGAMEYEAVVVPGMKTIRSSTLKILKDFAACGGKVIFMGEVPQYVDVEESAEVKKFAESCEVIEFAKNALLASVAAERELNIIDSCGKPADTLVYQLREEEGCRYLFVCNTNKERNCKGRDFTVEISGEWKVELLDTFTGAEKSVAAQYVNGSTRFSWDVFSQSHLLLKLVPGRQESGLTLTNCMGSVEKSLAKSAKVTLSEPNVLLLDQARWRVNGGEWNSREEILRIDNLIRKQQGRGNRTGQIAQPWVEKPDATKLCDLELLFDLECEVGVESCCIALEQPEYTTIFLDGAQISMGDCGWWTDEAIRKIELGKLSTGKHELVLKIAYSAATNLEWCYLLGDFGVRLMGTRAVITQAVTELYFADWTTQGMPFYSGNVTYHVDCEVDEDEFCLNIPHYNGAAIVVNEGGKRVAELAFEPYSARLSGKGKHSYDIVVLGTRGNSFAALHWAGAGAWYGPQAWRTEGDDWCYEYKISPMGILSTPRIHFVK